MNIHDCERLAKMLGQENMKFTAHFPVGPKPCHWLDIHMGIFKIDSPEFSGTFMSVRTAEEMFPNLECVTHEE